MKDSNIEQEYGRATALKIQRFNEETRKLNTVYLPQFEIIEYKASNGKVIKQDFVCISDDKNESGFAEFDSEIEALKFAISYRDNL